MHGYLLWNNLLKNSFTSTLTAGARVFLVLAVFLPGLSFRLQAQQPVIEVIDKTAPPRDTIRIVGGGFSEQKEKLFVYFGAAEGKISYASNTVLEVVVPEGATYGPVSVTHLESGLTGYSVQPFTMAYGGEDISEDSFEAQINFPAATGVHDLFLSDLNGDGESDVVATHTSENYIAVYPNSSSVETINFNAAIPLDAGSPTSNILCSDLDGDGKQDIIATAASGSKIFLFKNNSTPADYSFDSPVAVSLPHAPAAIRTGDLNKDGKPEIVVTHKNTNVITILKNESIQGTLQLTPDAGITAEGADGTAALAIADLNRDGAQDIIFGQGSGPDLFVFQNQSIDNEIIFSNATRHQAPVNVYPIITVDIDGDGRQDILGPGTGTDQIYVLLNNTMEAGDDIRLSSAIGLNTAADPTGVAAGDLDGKGGPDIIVATASKHLTVFRNGSTPGILSLQQFDLATDESNQYVQAGDLNSDGRPDIAFTSTDVFNLSVLQNLTCLSPEVMPEGPLTLCDGSFVRLETSQLSGVTYTWKKDNTVVKSGPEAFMVVETSGTYVLETTEAGLCDNSSDPVEVTVVSGDIPPAAEASSNSPVCQKGPLQLLATPVPDATYAWRGPDNFTSTEQNPVIDDFSHENAGRYFLTVIRGSCKSPEVSTLVEIADSPPPSLTVTADKNNVAMGESVQLEASGAFIYHWSPETGLSNPNIANPVATIDSTITYTVTGEDVSGCSATAEITITAENRLNVKPRNLFSPNGDRIDDYWQIEGIEAYPDCTVMIFNRQGQKVYEDRPYTNQWDGTYHGKPLPQGVYYFVIRCNGQENNVTGSITLIR